MQKKILIFVQTEYHLLLAINQILVIYNNSELYDIELFVRGFGGKRLSQSLDFSGLPIRVNYFNEEVTINKNLSQDARTAIQKILDINPDVFIFFQEMDPLMVILARHYSRNGIEVCLYQDGLKPYGHLKFHSLGLLKYFHQQNLWMKKNGFPVESWLSPIWAKKYAHNKSVKKVYLTFPESYKNWNNKSLEKIKMAPIAELNQTLKKVFRWDEALLPERENVILYMNQPLLRNDGVFEIQMLKEITENFNGKTLYVKLHPLTPRETINQFKKLVNLRIIKSQIPAELFIINLKKSIILSIKSTSMFINIKENKFFYLYTLFYRHQTSRYKTRNPAPHIKVIEKLEEITF